MNYKEQCALRLGILLFVPFLDVRIFNNNFLIIFTIKIVAHLFAIRTSPIEVIVVIF